MNSRPLTYIPLETGNSEALTPNHFLLGSSSGVKQPAAALTTRRDASRNNWNQIRHQLDLFWHRWLKEYLPTICRRTKWFEDAPPLSVGDLVLIADGKKRNNWIRGRICEIKVGLDGRARKAKVQTSTGILKRPVCNLAKLDVQLAGKTASDTLCYGGGNVSTDVIDKNHPKRHERK